MTKFYQCKICGNLVGKIIDSQVPLVCCGVDMVELIANTEEASQEKHLPVVEVKDDIIEVRVGSVDHPMEANHHITFIYLETTNGGQRKALKIDSEPVARFKVTDDQVLAVYAFCNLHGLWKTEV